MKKYYVKTNAYDCVMLVDDFGKAYVCYEEIFDEPLTLEVAKNTDYSNFDGCETAEECAFAIGSNAAMDNIYDFDEDHYESVVEF